MADDPDIDEHHNLTAGPNSLMAAALHCCVARLGGSVFLPASEIEKIGGLIIKVDDRTGDVEITIPSPELQLAMAQRAQMKGELS